MVRILIRAATSIVLLLIILSLVAPSAYADNCGSLSDCMGNIQAAIWALLALALLLAFIAFLPEILAGLASLAGFLGGFGGGGMALAGGGALSSNIAAATTAAAGISGAAAQGAIAAGVVAAAGELILMMSGDGTPGNNQAQNKQFRDAIRQYERETGNRLDKDQIRQIHDEISGQNMSYDEIIQTIYDLFGGGD